MSPTLMERCITAWLACHARVIGGRGPKVKYDGPTPDEILAASGITFDRHRRLYLRYEREMRRQAWERMGGKYSQGGHKLVEWVA